MKLKFQTRVFVSRWRSFVAAMHLSYGVS